MVRFDHGSEFKREFRTFLKQRGIKFYLANNPDTKAALVERAIRHLKDRLYRYFSHKRTMRWVDVLPSIIHSMNRSYHSSIKMRPIDVTLHNQDDVRYNLFGSANIADSYVRPNQLPSNRNLRAANTRDKVLKVGDFVRIAKYKGPLSKSYTPSFTKEIFMIVKRDPPASLVRARSDANTPHGGSTTKFRTVRRTGSPKRLGIINKGKPARQRTLFTVADEDGTVITGKFYAEELSEVIEVKPNRSRQHRYVTG